MNKTIHSVRNYILEFSSIYYDFKRIISYLRCVSWWIIRSYNLCIEKIWLLSSLYTCFFIKMKVKTLTIIFSFDVDDTSCAVESLVMQLFLVIEQIWIRYSKQICKKYPKIYKYMSCCVSKQLIDFSIA
jgi:hypothetical protein